MDFIIFSIGTSEIYLRISPKITLEIPPGIQEMYLEISSGITPEIAQKISSGFFSTLPSRHFPVKYLKNLPRNSKEFFKLT